MNVMFYVLIFIIGCLFGSFYTLAVHRIPRKEDILYTHSYCPNCHNKLGFFELIPVLSYIFLRGKCRHCGEKIRIRYLILELLSGAVFVFLAWALSFNIESLNIKQIFSFIFYALYATCLILIAGIDKEYRRIEKPVIAFAILLSLANILYLYIVDEPNMYRYAIYLVFFVILLILDNVTLKHYAKNSYVNQILLLSIVMIIFTNEIIYIGTVICTLLAMAIYLILEKIKNRKNKNKVIERKISETISIGYFLCFSHAVVLMVSLLVSYFYLK